MSNHLSKLQTEQAQAMARAMADTFNVSRHEFAIVGGGENAPCKPTLVYAARLGIWLGNWDDIRGPVKSPVPKEEFVIDVDGTEFDTRRGMTSAVYKALIAENPNRLNPDRPFLGLGRESYFFPGTWLTGQSAKPHWSPAGHVGLDDYGSPMPNEIGHIRSSDSLPEVYFRPSVQL